MWINQNMNKNTFKKILPKQLNLNLNFLKIYQVVCLRFHGWPEFNDKALEKLFLKTLKNPNKNKSVFFLINSKERMKILKQPCI